MTRREEPGVDDMDQVGDLYRAWTNNHGSGDRDPRDLDVARRRALGLPDDASPLEVGRALHQTPMDMLMAVRCEREYQQLVTSRPGLGVNDDQVSEWILQRRDAEAWGSREWWTLDRLRRRYLDAVVTGELGVLLRTTPVPVVAAAPVDVPAPSEKPRVSWTHRLLHFKRR